MRSVIFQKRLYGENNATYTNFFLPWIRSFRKYVVTHSADYGRYALTSCVRKVHCSLLEANLLFQSDAGIYYLASYFVSSIIDEDIALKFGKKITDFNDI